MRTLAWALGVLVVIASLLVAAGPMRASAAMPVAHVAAALPTRPAAATPPGYTRIRHYTNKAGFDRIVRDGVIRARDRGRVFGQDARQRPLSPRVAEERYRLGRGQGNHYIETDVPSERVTSGKTPGTGADEEQIKGDVPLRNPSGRCQ